MLIGARLNYHIFDWFAIGLWGGGAISYNADPETIKVNDFFLSKVGDNAETRREAVREADGWYAAFTHDIFG